MGALGVNILLGVQEQFRAGLYLRCVRVWGMNSLPVSIGRGVLGALMCLSFAVLCAPPPASALEHAAPGVAIFDPSTGSLESQWKPPLGLAAAAALGSPGKWDTGFEPYTAPRFAEVDLRDMPTVLDGPATWLMGARAGGKGHRLFLVDDKLALSLGVPLKITAGRVPILNNMFVQRKRDMRVKDLVLSLVNEKQWSVAAAHKLPIVYKPLQLGYGVYAQFQGSELRHVGLGFSGRLRF